MPSPIIRRFAAAAARTRRRALMLALLLGLATLADVAPDASAQATQQSPSAFRTRQRDEFRAALAALDRGQAAEARRLTAALAGYPLQPYLVFQELLPRLATLPMDDVARFLDQNAGSSLAAQLRTAWLRELARAGEWTRFLEAWQPQSDAELGCRQLVARVRVRPDATLEDDIRKQFLQIPARPAACDDAFAWLYASPRTDDALIWQRLYALARVGDMARARATATHVKDVAWQTLATRLLAAASEPDTVLATADEPATDATAAARQELLAYAIGRLAKRDLAQARSAFGALSARLAPGPAGAAARLLAIVAADNGDPTRIELLDQVPDAAVDADIERYRVREGIARQAWRELARWTAGTPKVPDEALRWRYWHARARAEQGDIEAATALFTALADERDYYGFLAADRLDRPYQLHDTPTAPTPAEREALLTRPGFERAREFDRVGLGAQARQEWSFELRGLEPRALQVAAVLAYEWGWPERAILALADANAYDDLTLRFPLLYRDIASGEAARHRIDAARVLAIIRIESAFRRDARSPAGALGLMQLMPETARETARAIGRRYQGPAMLSEPKENIVLGAEYLRRMLARYDGNFAMAAAAYNAGPGRLGKWQGDTCIPAERWVETIPFTETRGYVRRALFSAAIYQWRLGHPIDRLASAMPPIPPRDGGRCGQ